MASRILNSASLWAQSYFSISWHLFSMVCTYAITVLVTRVYGAESAGYYFLALAVVSIAAGIVRLGFPQVVTRSVAKYYGQNDLVAIASFYYPVMLVIFLAAAVLTTVLFYFSELIVLGLFEKPLLLPVFQIMCWSIIPFALYSVQGNFYQGEGSIAWYMLCANIGTALIFLACLAIDYVFFGALSYIAIAKYYVLASWLVLFFGMWKWHSGHIFVVSPVSRLAKYRHSAFRFWSMGLIVLAGMWGAQLIIGIYVEAKDVAIYIAAAKVAGATSLVLNSINAISAANFSNLFHKNDLLGLKVYALKCARINIVISLPFIIILFLFPKFFMGLFGSEFQTGSSILLILLLSQFVNIATGPIMNLLAMTKNENALFMVNALPVTLFIPLSIFLASTNGVIGVAWGQVIFVILQMILASYYGNKALGFSLLSVFWPSRSNKV